MLTQTTSSMQREYPLQRTLIVISLLVIVMLTLVACQGAGAEIATTEPGSAQSAVDAAENSAEPLPEGLVEITPLDPEQAAAPERLQIPAINMDIPVEPMSWDVVTIDGERTTLWTIPEDAAGWHVNSVGAGGAGTMAISGSQNEGDAVFAPLALGALQPGQEVQITDEDGIVFVYRIREISDPIPVSGASEDEKAEALDYLVNNPDGQLTLMTGWPDFTTTHRVFSAADFLGTLQ